MLKANYPDDIHTLQSIVRTSFDDIVWANLIAEQRAILRSAYLIRCVEEGFLDAFAGGRLNGTVHTCIGQEFVGVCVGQYLVDGDWVTSNHRCHGHFIVKTGDWRLLIDELLGKESGVCKGIGSSQHLFRPGFISNGPQGALLPVGTGIARRIADSGNVVVSFLGEGTLGEGITYEALNLAALLPVPQVFVCENNFYSQTTPQDANTSGKIVDRFSAFGIETFCANSWDLIDLRRTCEAAISWARSRRRPAAIAVATYRLKAHSKGDDGRDHDEIEFFEARDVLARSAQHSAELAEEFREISVQVRQYFEEVTHKRELPTEAS